MKNNNLNNYTEQVMEWNLSKYVHFLLGFVGGVAILYGINHLINNERFIGSFDLFIGVVLMGLLVLRKKISIKKKSVFLAMFFLLFLPFLVYDEATGNIGFLWILLYPSIVFHILEKDTGKWWVGLGSLFLVGFLILNYLNVLTLPYEQIVVIQFNVVYVVSSILAYLTESDRFNKAKLFRELSTKLYFIIRNSPLVVFILNKNGIFTFSDGAGLKSLNLSPGEVVGKSALEIYKDYPLIIKGIKKALDGAKTNETVIIGKFVFKIQFSPVIDGDNKVAGVMGLAIDVTEEQRSKSEIEIKLKEMSKLNKLMVGREVRMAEMKKELEQVRGGVVEDES